VLRQRLGTASLVTPAPPWWDVGAGLVTISDELTRGHPALLSSSDPPGGLHRGGGQLVDTPARLGKNIVDQLWD